MFSSEKFKYYIQNFNISFSVHKQKKYYCHILLYFLQLKKQLCLKVRLKVKLKKN